MEKFNGMVFFCSKEASDRDLMKRLRIWHSFQQFDRSEDKYEKDFKLEEVYVIEDKKKKNKEMIEQFGSIFVNSPSQVSEEEYI
ncbi:hypothetical protein PRIPAC_95996 [Pristionchus pacificus]|uniref:Uncharacterized protein n=1 Tax=Pristionchus pacificus TaxID=54126 RepID=A0A2A6BCD8_PRIPA|nr:hypothetical protein PRIPAC_95996 [Pristionchus pacificus]|eukprot:PDM63545.1 hypothetical protein PRIPAC_49518 [Pristionchus pacificus]